MQNLTLNELAAEGERLCKLGDCQNGLRYFEEALKVYNDMKLMDSYGGSDMMLNSLNDNYNNHHFDSERHKLLQTISIIYNQMGNAHFYLQNYEKALYYHKKDLEICERFNDEPGKAKACGNIGNTLQLLGDYDEAILYSLRNLDTSIKLNDTTGEARALYNLGNIYQSKGKHMGRITYQTNSDLNNENTRMTYLDFPMEIKDVLLKAIFYYRKTLTIVSNNKDRAAEGRTYGNLGNTYYLLGDFDSAIECHSERLRIAKEYGDRAAERRAFSNLGNCHIFLGKFLEASDFYLKAMNIARLLGDRAIEAQSYFSLGNVYTLLQDYTIAIDFHLRHLQIAILLEDKIGESRAYWSLGNAYAALGDFENAIMYANRHLNLARLIGDPTSELTAKMNLYDFQNLLNSYRVKDNESHLFTPVSRVYDPRIHDRLTVNKKSSSIDSLYSKVNTQQINKSTNNNNNNLPTKSNTLNNNQNNENINSNLAKSDLNLNEFKKPADVVTPPVNNNNSNKQQQISKSNIDLTNSTNKKPKNDLSFLDVLSRIQSNRLDDQRCSIKLPTTTAKSKTLKLFNNNKNVHNVNNNQKCEKKKTDDDFFNLLIQTQSSRLEDQRTQLTKSNKTNAKKENNKPIQLTRPAVTVPPENDDDFFSMLQKIQSRRLDEQRSVSKSSSTNKLIQQISKSLSNENSNTNTTTNKINLHNFS